MKDLRGQSALVTGASSGIGAEMSRQLAARGCELVLSARRAERLEALASELREAHEGRVHVVPCDLAQPGAPARLYEEATDGGKRPLDILINNAGFGSYQRFAADPWERHAEMLQLNVTSVVELTHRFLADALSRERRAWVMNVSSLVGVFFAPFMSTYSGTKGFILLYSEALARELRGTNASVTCLCPGATATEFSDVAGQRLSPAARKTLMTAKRCARIALEGLFSGKRLVVPGFFNKMVVVLNRLVPRPTIGSIFTRILGEPEPPAAREGQEAEAREGAEP